MWMELEKALGLRVGEVLIGLEFGPPGLGQPRDAAARIVRVRHGLDQALVLQAAQQAAHQAGIEVEIVADRRDVGAPLPDRVEHAGGAERTAAAEEGGVEGADLGGHGAVEAANAGNGVNRHNI